MFLFVFCFVTVTFLIRSLTDVTELPKEFDQEALIATFQNNFQASGVSIHSLSNIVYLIYRYMKTPLADHGKYNRVLLFAP